MYNPALTFFSLLLTVPLINSTPIPDPPNFSFETLNFVFEGGPASYTLSFPADGNYHPTNNTLSVSSINAGTFPALYECAFYAADGSYIQAALDQSSTGTGPIDVGPPQPIASVACAPTGANGQCLPVYTTCEWSGLHGTFLLDCCSGYCAATKCRPTS